MGWKCLAGRLPYTLIPTLTAVMEGSQCSHWIQTGNTGIHFESTTNQTEPESVQQNQLEISFPNFEKCSVYVIYIYTYIYIYI